MAQLDGKVAVITGGASGIGEGAVRRFVEAGARVVIADVQDARGQKLTEELGTATSFRHVDVAQEADVQGAIAHAVKTFGCLDCMINNAGIGGGAGPIEETDMAACDATLAVLLRGVVLGMKHAAKLMKAQGSGSIISTASVAGLGVGYGPHIYSAAKAAVIHLTRSVANELGESGIRVNCICPGFIVTPIFGKAMGLSAEQADLTLDAVKGVGARAQPVQRAGMPADIAEAMLWLASDASSFVTGHALVVDGGLTTGMLWSERQKLAEQRFGGAAPPTAGRP
ncbi:MAG TPA: glucose 1-dehydrogenase [Dehalococcoidia bacterium]|nr:glucose 1-dehydrogenase [Dehalococcoidia bacterium]